MPAELKICVASFIASIITGAKFSAKPPSNSPLAEITLVTPLIFLQFCKTSSTSSSTNKEILSLIFCAAVIVDKVPLSTSLLLDSAITNTDII